MANIHVITVPQWGLEMTEGDVAAWHIGIGDRITKGCEIVDIETAKIINTMEAMNTLSGGVRRLLAKVGDTLQVGAPLVLVAEDSVSEQELDEYLQTQGLGKPARTASESEPVTPAALCVAVESNALTAVEPPVVVLRAAPVASRVLPDLEKISQTNGQVNTSPVALRVANQAGIDLTALTGSGRHGRVSLDDVHEYAAAQHIEVQSGPAILPQFRNNGQQQRNLRVHASPVALRVAQRDGIELAAIVGSGRHGRVSLADVQAVHQRIPGQPAACLMAVQDDSLRAGPAARKLAAELGIELSSLSASGPRQVVLKDDVREAFKSSLPDQIEDAPKSEFELIALTPMRKAIAASLVHSKQTIPHFYLTVDLNLDPLMNLRNEINLQAEGQPKLSLNDFVLRATALALKEVPAANVQFCEEGIKQFNSVQLCVAVAIDGGLVTPVVRNAELKSVFDISREVVTLAEAARKRALSAAQLSGGSFTVSNLGMYGIRQFDAVINAPQGAILAVGGIRREACEGKAGGVTFASLMSVTLSCDHRVIDGAVGATFLAAFRKRIERPYSLLG